METIFALSSGALPAGVAVVRISGPKTGTILQTLCGAVPEARRAALRFIRDRNGVVIDRGLVLWFPGPASFTGEDCAEIHLHGGRAVVDCLFDALGCFADTRMAEPGEYSRRAFVNGKLDLTEAEGLADLIAAETESQRVLALAQSTGTLRAIYEGWQSRLLHARAMIEAEIDFADEEDVPGSVADTIWTDMALMIDEMQHHLEGAKAGAIIREGFRVAIVGAPNAGKSSLLNALSGSDVAIVSDIEGTTRDAIETRIVIDGNLVLLTDTAGLRTSDDPIETEGIRRTYLRAAEADLVLYLADNGRWDELEGLGDVPVWRVWSKADLARASENVVALSLHGAPGLGELMSALRTHLSATLSRSQETLPSRLRHVDNVRSALEELKRAVTDAADPLEIRAERLRMAADALGRILGHRGVEDILGVIFSEFCVGK
ncbi:tRNA uridine-5-carboxymethylaminomethyl(34) synthesis GTPase MnmE [Oricola sp.]|uniref:tRNA uridine-5-carboxymethylaminomethyl(34) synthesis GTPase MnmE n=1 Tax=Oricola sp. TaxID=1979950 RepID=UPI003BAB3FC7